MPVKRLVVIAAGGVVGSLARYGVALAIGPWHTGQWPWATLVVNVLGCLAIGVIASSAMVASGPDWLRPLLVTGVLGGFTTFSAFALETGLLMDAGSELLAAMYVSVTMVAGLLAVRAGVAIGGSR
jgi:CrcB protein